MSNVIIQVNQKCKKIDDKYFNEYGGGHYSKNYLDYTYHPFSVISQFNKYGISFKTLLDAGCASGELVKDFRKRGIEAYGFDNNPEVIKNNVCPDFCFLGDLRNLKEIKEKYDVIYLNSAMYLFPHEVEGVLKDLHSICNVGVFLCNPFLGETNPTNDPYRTFLAKPIWWDKQFSEANFYKKDKNIYLKQKNL